MYHENIWTSLYVFNISCTPLVRDHSERVSEITSKCHPIGLANN